MDIAIIGMAEREIPRGVELWGMPWDGESGRFDVLFDLHDLSMLTDKHKEKLKNCHQPLYMQDGYYHNSTRYPIESVIEIVGDYFASTVSYMLGFAIYKKVGKIDIYGVTGAENYAFQRPNLEYLIGFARGRGIEVNVHGKTELFSGKRYGFI